MLRIKIETGNAAFAERVRGALGYAPDAPHISLPVRDVNGNTVGAWQYTAD